MVVEIPTFDYDYWRDPNESSGVKQRDDWEKRGLHWHCHSWRGDGAQWSKFGYTHPENVPADMPPNRPDYWLQRPSTQIKLVATTPEEAHDWLRGLYDPVEQELGELASGVDKAGRFGRALYDLRCGNHVSWGFWLNGASTLYSMMVVATPARCH